eukprot:TRINITY_DN177_c0_g1_i1.p1 TRINITY_DN177_c0_g1~~TRINITY_DN177_c0_g1_i1.p1  ORF type:complete len:189 (+),score=56.95 TRINITY_DN177_c0_g1_i1:118-684(+)
MSQAEESEVPASVAAEEEDADHEDDEEDEEDEEVDKEDEPARSKAAVPPAPVKKTKKDSLDKKKVNTTSSKAGLCFPVARLRKSLKEGGYAKRIPIGGAIYLTAVIEYIVAEILELAGNSAKEQKKNRIIPRHIQLAIRNDEELNKYMSNVTIQGGGVIPNIHTVLMPNKNPPKGGAAGASGSFSQEY